MRPYAFVFQCSSFLLMMAMLASCSSLEKEIILSEPPHERQLVVECYLERGKPYRMALTESVNYQDQAFRDIPVINQARVKISYDGQTDVLENTNQIEIDKVNRKAYNYALEKTVTGDVNTEYTLEATDSKGRKVTGTTRFLSPVTLKDLTWKFNDKDKAYLTVRFDDPPGTKDYYRFVVNRDSLTGSLETRFNIDDRFTTNNEITRGTGYDYEDGDTLVVTLYHIEKSYYDFLESANRAANANGNPFGQPSLVKSTVQGGIGVFTTLVYDRKQIIVKKTR